jgi:hypothetical protein
MSQFSVLYGQVGNLTSSQSVSFDKLVTNEALHDILKRRSWSFLRSTTTVPLVAGQRGYTVLGTTPVVTDFGSPISVTLEQTASQSRKKLPRVDEQLFEDLTGHSYVNGVPIMWSFQGGTANTTSATIVQGGQQQIVLAPPPTAAAGQGVNIIIRYWRSLASCEMTADTDIPILPAQYHGMLVQRACSIALTRNLMPQDAAGFERDFELQLAAAIDADVQLYSGDNDTIVLKAVPQVPAQVPLTPPEYSPQTRPYPASV